MIRRLDTATLGALGVAKTLDRSPAAVDAEIHRRVEEIVATVRDKGDSALLDFTERYDHVALTAAELVVTSAELSTFAFASSCLGASSFLALAWALRTASMWRVRRLARWLYSSLRPASGRMIRTSFWGLMSLVVP